MSCWAMRAREAIGQAIVKNYSDRTRTDGLRKLVGQTKFVSPSANTSSRHALSFVKSEQRTEGAILIGRIDSALSNLSVSLTRPLDDFVDEGLKNLIGISTDITTAFQSEARLNSDIQTAVINSHDFGEGVVFGFLEVVDGTARDWDFTAGMPVLKRSIVDGLFTREVFLDEDRQEVEKMLGTVRVNGRSVLEILETWWRKYSTIDEILTGTEAPEQQPTFVPIQAPEITIQGRK
ncbi:hypothetical protein HZC34_04310 [Candidatus Saganbacteria bacterium]|nr:hypothetical protein [Candidatus Saganbacteria bacterium]